MLDRADVMFKNALERIIHTILDGNDQTPGLYRNIVGSQTWEGHQRAAGAIMAYEDVLNQMRALAKRLNGDEPEQRDQVGRMN